MDDPDTNTFVNCETDLYLINSVTIQTTANYICTALGFKKWELSITFVDSAAMRTLNAEFRKVDRSTDVLSFPQQEWTSPLTLDQPFKPTTISDDLPPFMLGDLVISVEDAAANARDIGHSINREIGFLLVHGILHLCGHDHQQPVEEELMTTLQRLLMQQMTEKFKQPLWEKGVIPAPAGQDLLR